MMLKWDKYDHNVFDIHFDELLATILYWTYCYIKVIVYTIKIGH